MRFRTGCLLQTAILLLASSALANSPMIQVRVSGPDGPGRDLLVEASNLASEIFYKMFQNMVPDPSGVDYPSVFEKALTTFDKRLADSNFFFLIQGTGVLKLLEKNYFYQELEGGLGVSYSFFNPERKDLVLMVRFSPLYGEIAYVRGPTGGRAETQLPSEIFMGMNAGAELWKTFGPLDVGVKAYGARLWDRDDATTSGYSKFAGFFLRLPLDRFASLRLNEGRMVITASVEYYDRGAFFETLSAWQDGDTRLTDLRHVWNGKLMLNFYH